MTALNEELLTLLNRSVPFNQWAVEATEFWCRVTQSQACSWLPLNDWADHCDNPTPQTRYQLPDPAKQTLPLIIDQSVTAWPLMEAGWLLCEGATDQPEGTLLAHWDGLRHQWLLRGRLAIAEQRASFGSWMLSAVSHDLRAPLNSIMSFLELAEQPDYDWHARLPTVRHDASQLNRLISQILDFSRLQANRLVLVPKTTDLLDWVGDLVEFWRGKLYSKQLSFRLYLADALPANIELDSERLSQIVHNLMSNAFKYTEHGGIELAVMPGKQPHELVIEVSDSGAGIEASQLPLLFDPYTQSRHHDQFKDGGVGLGLNIVKQLSDLMDGHIAVSSEPGQGSVFKLRVPYQPAPEPEVKSDNKVMHQQWVLVIDDDQRRTSSLVNILVNLGASVTWVRTGPEALFHLRQREVAPDWVLISAGLTGIGAEQTLEQIVAQLAWSVQTASDSILWLNDQSHQTHSTYRSMTMPASAQEVYQALTFSAPVDAVSNSPTILVVDDTDLNLQMTQIQLEKLGVKVITAESGELALAAIKQYTVDLVFMDIMMPDMDGYETTEHIRAYEEARGLNPVPIIALTANALFNDPAKCRDANMDDYLSKPYRPDQLKSVVKRYIPTFREPGLPRSVEAQPSTVIKTAGDNLVNWKQALLMVGGDEPILLTILKPFVEELPATYSTLEKAYEQGDWHALQRQAHSLKGMLRTFGAGSLGDAAYQLERAARDSDAESARQAWGAFNTLYLDTLKRLSTYLGGNDT
ncbi:MAG: response regulator [Saccharospirillum sp.]|uniref:response regulator n=1 Tax=Saccharospirillum sp. TaxID=2033801 RepID=UPI00329938F3